MVDNQPADQYKSPKVVEYGSVESITEQQKKNKEGSSVDNFSPGTPLVGSTSPAG